MSVPSRCISVLSKRHQNLPISRITQRSFASSTRHPTTSSRTAPRGNTVCLRAAPKTHRDNGRTWKDLQGQIRTFSQSSSRSKLTTIDQIRARNKGGVSTMYICISHALEGYIERLRIITDANDSLSISQLPYCLSQPEEDYGHTLPTRKSAWRESA